MGTALRAGKFGKKAAKEDPRTLRLGAYLTPALPPPPPAYSILPRVETGTKVTDPRRLFPMDGNGDNGCCTIAAAAHAETVWEGVVGRKRVPTTRAVLADYYRLTGGPDTGLYELDVLNHWRQEGLTGERILAYAKVDHHDHDMVRSAISLFGGVYLGFTVQAHCIEEFNAGQPWTPGPLTHEGHAVLAVAYGPRAVQVLTWGSTQWATWEWWDECVDECYSILPGEAVIAGYSPGLDLAALKADLAAVTA